MCIISGETVIPCREIIFINTNIHFETDSVQNNNHSTLITIKVKSHLIGLGIFASCFSNILSRIINKPWSIPHRIKDQFAPCQSPLIPNTIIVFTYVRSLPFLLPPSGIYIYFVKNFVSEICQRFQKSLIDSALYGESKFIGSVILSMSDEPTAMSL